eukprot:scaffold10199_cov146-Cylindrotheca_fusiformis.AAC.13
MAVTATKILPTIQKLATSVTQNPRWDGGASSVTRVNSAGTVAPMPIPEMHRSIDKMVMLGDRQLANPATALHPNPKSNMGRRPTQSPMVPRKRPPTNIPKKTAAANHPPLSSFSSWTRKVAAKSSLLKMYDRHNISDASDELAIPQERIMHQ